MIFGMKSAHRHAPRHAFLFASVVTFGGERPPVCPNDQQTLCNYNISSVVFWREPALVVSRGKPSEGVKKPGSG